MAVWEHVTATKNAVYTQLKTWHGQCDASSAADARVTIDSSGSTEVQELCGGPAIEAFERRCPAASQWLNDGEWPLMGVCSAANHVLFLK